MRLISFYLRNVLGQRTNQRRDIALENLLANFALFFAPLRLSFLPQGRKVENTQGTQGEC